MVLLLFGGYFWTLQKDLKLVSDHSALDPQQYFHITLMTHCAEMPSFYFAFCCGIGVELVTGGPWQGHLREEWAAGEVLPWGEGQSWGPEGVEPGLQGHRDGPGGEGCGPQGEDRGHHSKGSAAQRILSSQTSKCHRFFIKSQEASVDVFVVVSSLYHILSLV